jgi:hypothetical protein
MAGDDTWERLLLAVGCLQEILMNKLALAPLALAVLAGCATHDKVTPAPAPVAVAPAPPVVTQAPSGTVVVPQAGAGGTAVVVPAAPGPLRVGIGTIDTITPVPNSSSKRVGIRMADNSVQYLDTSAAGMSVGQRVEITSDGYMKRPAP